MIPERPPLLEAALARWRVEVGDTYVSTDPMLLDAVSTATFPTSQRVAGVVQPANADQVAACLRVASECSVALYPVSAGRNWGLGSRLPVKDANVLLDLGRLKRISEFDQRFGYVRVEPGVTFRELHAFLQGSNLFLPAIGGPPEASVIGNCVERGDAAGARGDRLANLCDLDIILPDGDRLRSGFGRFGDSPLSPLSNRPPGPQLDGLFTQSNLGVVVAATLWLTPVPEILQVFTARVGEPPALSGLVDALQSLIMQGGLGERCVSLWNAYRLLPRLGRYPWTARAGATPLWLREGEAAASPWFVSGAIHAPTAAMADAQRDFVAPALAPHVHALAFRDTRCDPDLWQDAAGFVGAPSEVNAAAVYWRKRGRRQDTLDPDGDRCGVLWVCLAVPFEGRHVAAFVAESEELVLHAGFEPMIGLECASARVLHAFVLICYDRDITGDDERAGACRGALLDAAARAGLHPYRLDIQSMARRGSADGYQRAVAAIKSALDPCRILAPGRYDGVSGDAPQSALQ